MLNMLADENMRSIKVNGGNVLLKGCTIEGCGEYGIFVVEGGSVRCEECKVVRNAKSGVLARGEELLRRCVVVCMKT